MRPSTAILTLLPCLSLSSPTPQPPSSDWPSLSALLSRVDTSILHTVMHQLSPKYQHGVFHEDRSAIAHVHSSDHVMATKLVHMALKRQDNGTVTTEDPSTTDDTTVDPTLVDPPPSSTTTTSPPSTTPPADPTTTPPADPSTTPPSSAADTPSSDLTSALGPDITATTEPDPTTATLPPTTPPDATPIETVTNGVVFSTVGGGVVTETSRNVAISFTRSSSTRLITSTAADGRVETLTSVVVVNAPVTSGDGMDQQGAAATSGPGLQDGAPGAVRVDGRFVGAMVGAAVLAGGAAWAL